MIDYLEPSLSTLLRKDKSKGEKERRRKPGAECDQVNNVLPYSFSYSRNIIIYDFFN